MDSGNGEIAPLRPTLLWIIIITLGQNIENNSECLEKNQKQTEMQGKKGTALEEFPTLLKLFACKISCTYITVDMNKNAYSSQFTWLKTGNRRV